MDIVIPLGKGSLWQDNELRYALRSIENNLRDYRDIYIIGHKPSWIKNVIHIPHDDPHRCKERNIMEKVRTACLLPGVSDLFLFSNDDLYFMEPMSAYEVGYYHSGPAEEYVVGKRLNGYLEVAKRTYEELKLRGLPSLYFDIHVPIPYSKKAFLEVTGQYKWNPKGSYIVKTIYCNTLKIAGEFMADVKRKEGGKFYSTTDKVLGLQRLHLESSFPEPSSYE